MTVAPTTVSSAERQVISLRAAMSPNPTLCKTMPVNGLPPETGKSATSSMALQEPAPVVTESIYAPSAAVKTTPLADAGLAGALKVVSPLSPAVWARSLLRYNLLSNFADIPLGLSSGFRTGVSSTLLNSYTPDNHSSATAHPEIVSAYIQKELTAGRYSGPFSFAQLYSTLGPFRTAPLGLVPKPHSSNFRLIQDLSFPRNDPLQSSVNAEIDSSHFPCEWSTFAHCYFAVANAPPGSQAAVFDVDSAYRNIPIHPDDQRHFCLMWDSLFYVDHCVAFGSASSAGLFGRVADALAAIFRAQGIDCVLKWVDDFVFFRFCYPTTSASLYRVDASLVFHTARSLGVPWKLSKYADFSSSFTYLGFSWCFASRSVSLLDDKRLKFLIKLSPWLLNNPQTLSSAQKLLGSLNHCCYVLPLGRSHLHHLRKFVASFSSNSSPFLTHKIPSSLSTELQWWHSILQDSPPPLPISTPPDPLDVPVFVDASTSFGVGILIRNRWNARRLTTDVLPNGFIGVLEMLAVEFAVSALTQMFPHHSHFLIHSDNQGVVASLRTFSSKGLLQNESLSRTLQALLQHESHLSAVYVPSVDNPADPISRGLLPPLNRRLHVPITVPASLVSLLVSA